MKGAMWVPTSTYMYSVYFILPHHPTQFKLNFPSLLSEIKKKSDTNLPTTYQRHPSIFNEWVVSRAAILKNSRWAPPKRSRMVQNRDKSMIKRCRRQTAYHKSEPAIQWSGPRTRRREEWAPTQLCHRQRAEVPFHTLPTKQKRDRFRPCALPHTRLPHERRPEAQKDVIYLQWFLALFVTMFYG